MHGRVMPRTRNTIAIARCSIQYPMFPDGNSMSPVVLQVLHDLDPLGPIGDTKSASGYNDSTDIHHKRIKDYFSTLNAVLPVKQIAPPLVSALKHKRGNDITDVRQGTRADTRAGHEGMLLALKKVLLNA